MRPAGVRWQSLLRRRGRALHQRPGRGERRLARRGRPRTRRAADRRAAPGRRLELRGAGALDTLVVQHHDLRARGAARVRALREPRARGDDRPAPRRGVPARAPPLPPQVHRRGDRARSQGWRVVVALRVPDLVALRRAARARAPASRRRLARPARGRGDRPGGGEARRARPVAARDSVCGPDAGRDGRRRGPAEPLEHALRVLNWWEGAGAARQQGR